MGSFPVSVLSDIVTKFPDACKSDRLLESIVNDRFKGDHKPETNRLILAVKEKVVADLVTGRIAGKPDAVLQAKLQARLTRNWGMTDRDALWTIQTWTAVIKAIPEQQFQDLFIHRTAGEQFVPKADLEAGKRERAPPVITPPAHPLNVSQNLDSIPSDLINSNTLKDRSGAPIIALCNAVSPNGKLLVIGGYQIRAGRMTGRIISEAMMVWSLTDLTKIEELYTIQGKAVKYQASYGLYGICAAVFSPDSLRIAAGSEEFHVKVWDIADGQVHRVFKGHKNVVTSIDFNHNGRLIASGSLDRTIKVWAVEKAEAPLINIHAGHEIFSTRFSPCGRYLATAGNTENVRIWDVESGAEIRTLQCQSTSVEALEFSPDGRILATGSMDGPIRLWDTDSWEVKGTLLGHQTPIKSICFRQDETVLASSAQDGSLKLWDLKTETELRSLNTLNTPMTLKFSPDNRFLIASGSDKLIVLGKYLGKTI